jgi:hypothetical protein
LELAEKHFDEAAELLARALAEQRVALELRANDASYRSAYSTRYWNWIQSLLRAKRYAEAARAAWDYSGEFADRWQEAQYATDFLLLAAAQADEDESLEESARAALRQDFSDKADQLIDRALNLGFPLENPDHADIYFLADWTRQEFFARAAGRK